MSAGSWRQQVSPLPLHLLSLMKNCSKETHMFILQRVEDSPVVLFSGKATLDEALIVPPRAQVWLTSAFFCFYWAPTVTCMHPQESRQTHS